MLKRNKKKKKIYLGVFLILIVLVSYSIISIYANNKFMDYVFEKCPKTLTVEEYGKCYIDLGGPFIVLHQIGVPLFFLLLLIIFIIIENSKIYKS